VVLATMINSYLSSALCICCIEFSRHSKDENGTSSQQLTESRRTGSVKEKPGWFWAGPSSFWSCSASFYPSSMMYNNCRRKKLNSETLMTQLRDKSCSMHSAHPSEHNFYIPWTNVKACNPLNTLDQFGVVSTYMKILYPVINIQVYLWQKLYVPDKFGKSVQMTFHENFTVFYTTFLLCF
jgi:hypothetical protein